MKTCSRCTAGKPEGEFAIRRGKPGTICRECERSRLTAWRSANPGRLLPAKRRWQHENIEKRRAHKAVELAIGRGDLKVKPCERCGYGVGVQAHHDDYAKPLDVTWLCARCHGARHRELRAA